MLSSELKNGVAEVKKIRTRFGLKVSISVLGIKVPSNAGTFVTYLTEKQFKAASDALTVFKNQVGGLANSDLRTFLVDQLFIEKG